ncbi:hypothetical protein [Pseudoxanthomonas daejeonensis]|uniref:Lipoprotein n=1 Tax=Pseudoxanthomonas daejeonensis TaxID=266062 RepID=A0ABQ6Z3N4_9GAMM|nr:hypothetical protein [Pseudoxanthomonas daejeonensis]KAF1692222.1 hypothetical protein CSC65_14765 [Pseudoxanthomonas daejeonensis]
MRSNVALCLAALLLPGAALACDPAGAYGIAFGDKPGRDARKQPGSGTVTIWYQVTPPQPDTRFDRYLVRTDAATGRIYQVDGVRTIIPLERSEGLTDAQRAAGVQQAEAFAQDYFASLPPDIRSRLVDEYGTSHREGAIADGTWMTVDVNFSWDVTVSCRDLAGERVMGERVLPEMFR